LFGGGKGFNLEGIGGAITSWKPLIVNIQCQLFSFCTEFERRYCSFPAQIQNRLLLSFLSPAVEGFEAIVRLRELTSSLRYLPASLASEACRIPQLELLQPPSKVSSPISAARCRLPFREALIALRELYRE
jgi:hypothetical protein